MDVVITKLIHLSNKDDYINCIINLQLLSNTLLFTPLPNDLTH
jgi:hypothetical protein